MNDKFSIAVSRADFCAGILGSPEAGYFLSWDFDLAQLEAVRGSRLANNVRFIGILSIVDGQPETALAEPLDDPATIEALSAAFVAKIAEGLPKAVVSTEWLEKLWALPSGAPWGNA
jgi:hypothetical protein